MQDKIVKFTEAVKWNENNFPFEICVCMLLVNPEFLDNILDKGLKARYSENTSVFINDLKNMIVSKNRLVYGKFNGEKWVEDSELGKISNLVNQVTFDIQDDWNKLVNARNTARNIQDKIIQDDKLRPEMIKWVFWTGPNKVDDRKEDIVIELEDGRQLSLFINKNLNTSKTVSFSTIMDDLIGLKSDLLYAEEYTSKWDKLTQEWVKTIYEGSAPKMKEFIQKFIHPDRIDTITYEQFFDIKHSDVKYRHLGEHVPQLAKNYLELSDLLSDIYKDGNHLIDKEKTILKWEETKRFILNSRMLEYLLTNSIKDLYDTSLIEKQDDGSKLAGGPLKMKFMKLLVNLLNCEDRDIYMFGSSNSFFHVPSKKFFRQHYHDFKIRFNYHVKLSTPPVEGENDFKFEIWVDLNDKELIKFDTFTKFSGGEMSGKLSTKVKVNIVDDFNWRIWNIENK
jgi:hypothetical protein